MNAGFGNNGQHASFCRSGFNNLITEHGYEYWQVDEI